MNQLLAKPKLRAMTSDEVLGLFHQWSMVEYWFTLEEVKARLGRDISVHKLLAEVDYLGNWKKFGETLNKVFDIDLSQSQWKPYLQWPRQRNVGDLCDFISQHAVMEQIEPAEILGRSCLEAGAFRSILSLLNKAGADICDIAPSARVGPYIKKYSNVFFTELGKVAPGAFPKFEKFDHNLIEKSALSVLALIWISLPIISSLSLVLSSVSPLFLLIAGCSFSIFLLVWIIGMICSKIHGYLHPVKEDHRTFKQLCYVIADTMRCAHDDRLREASDGIGTCSSG